MTCRMEPSPSPLPAADPLAVEAAGFDADGESDAPLSAASQQLLLDTLSRLHADDSAQPSAAAGEGDDVEDDDWAEEDGEVEEEVLDALDWLDLREDLASRGNTGGGAFGGGFSAARRPNAFGGQLNQAHANARAAASGGAGKGSAGGAGVGGTAGAMQPRVNKQQRLTARVNAAPMRDWGDSCQLNMANVVMTAVRDTNKRQEQGQSRVKEKADRATVEQVLDPRTRMVLFKMLNRGVFSQINGCLSTGKEANVYHATVDCPSALHMPAALGIGGGREGAGVQEGGEGQPVKELAVKVYKTSILVFKDRERYVAGDYRFRHGYSKHNPRKMVKVWAEKEFRNLNRSPTAVFQLLCTLLEALAQSFHGLCCNGIHVVARYCTAGTEGWGAPRLKDVQLSEGRWRECYGQVVLAMWRMYRLCRLVHGDLSEYNLLYLQGRVWVIDVSQSVDLDHPRALDFLREDCLHVTDFFRRKGMAVLTVRELFDFVTDPVMPESLVDDCLHKLQERAASRPLEPTAQEAIAEAVFLQSFIPQSLDQVKDAEKDIRRIASATKAAAQQQAATPSKTQQAVAHGGEATGAAAGAAGGGSGGNEAALSSVAPPLEGIFYPSLLGLKADLSGVRTLPDILQAQEEHGDATAGRGGGDGGHGRGEQGEERSGAVRGGGEGDDGEDGRESDRGGAAVVPCEQRGGAEGMEGGQEQQSEEGSEEGSDLSEDEGGEEEGGRRGKGGAVSKEEVRAARKENKKKVKEEKRVARLDKVPKAVKRKKKKAAESKKR
ncbi:unnamed protein product [Closterium sp. Yama58-4]|nr:unnamed protein product [Closterium sp. Yama58-4]